jgi:hypothetical protein
VNCNDWEERLNIFGEKYTFLDLSKLTPFYDSYILCRSPSGAVSLVKINEKLLIFLHTRNSYELTPFTPSLWKRGGWGRVGDDSEYIKN